MYMRRISDWIFIWCTLGSGGLATKYSFSVCRGQVDYWPNIHWVFECVWQITEWTFIGCINGSGGLLTGYSFSVWHRSGGLLTKYSVGVCRDPADYQGQADYWPVIHSVYGIGQADFWPNIHLVYAGIRRIPDWIFIWCMQGSGRLPIGYSLIELGSSELNI